MGTDQRDGSERSEATDTRAAEPTRRTLVFPSVEVVGPRAVVRRGPPRPPLALVAPERASERPTLKTLPPFDEPSSGHGNTEVIELSASALDSDVSMGERSRDDVQGGDGQPARGRGRMGPRRVLVGVVAVLAMGLSIGVAPSVASVASERASGVSDGLGPRGRETHEPASEHTPLAERATPRSVSVAPGTCATLGAPRVLATRAHLPPGLDVSVLGAGFGVGFASSADDALGLRLDVGDLPLRVVDRVRVRGRVGARMGHVAVSRGAQRAEGRDDHAGDEDDDLDVRVDGDDARTVAAGGEAPFVRIAVGGGWMQVRTDAKGAARTLWPLPGGAAGVKARAEAGASALRVAARDEGGAVIALRRRSALWLGVVDRELAAEGPLVPLTRPGALLGMPAVAPAGGGGVVAWAERPAGEREWNVMVATFGGGPESGRSAPVAQPIAAGMSPSISALPGGDLLLAYAVGAAGEHRVIVRRLGQDLGMRGEPVAVSPDALNAGQPAMAVAADGRALVAFFGAERGRPSRVLATPLSCSVGL